MRKAAPKDQNFTLILPNTRILILMNLLYDIHMSLITSAKEVILFGLIGWSKFRSGSGSRARKFWRVFFFFKLLLDRANSSCLYFELNYAQNKNTHTG